MEDGASDTVAVHVTASAASPPPPPDPNVDDATAAVPLDATPPAKTDDPLVLDNERWDVTSVSAHGALRMLAETLQKLSEATGDVPPTPPVSRPSTPHQKLDACKGHMRRVSSSRTLAVGAEGLPSMPEMTSPEAHPHEPITVQVGSRAEDLAVQQAAIARRFFSKVAPPFTLIEYLLRLHKFCPHSSGVYLTAVAYIHALCISSNILPITTRTIHRLSLAAIRIAAKAVEDNKWAQERVAKVGGISNHQLMNLEVALCFLLDFELFVDEGIMARRMFLLQQAARHRTAAKGRLSDQSQLKLPPSRIKAAQA
ncbi:cyclin-domain-containing protein [Lecanosticta acicola]|uniref:Cyclin-domain-containing protein n=1 Tax=Lecanosticta acicola TaxID=111012 RepID=A0AAI9EEY5_9PEZI|nr:cyclin-domain-containing protein [Lecanosticta acicola]